MKGGNEKRIALSPLDFKWKVFSVGEINFARFQQRRRMPFSQNRSSFKVCRIERLLADVFGLIKKELPQNVGVHQFCESNPELTRRGAMIELLEDLPFANQHLQFINESQQCPLPIRYFPVIFFLGIAGSSRKSIWQ